MQIQRSFKWRKGLNGEKFVQLTPKKECGHWFGGEHCNSRYFLEIGKGSADLHLSCVVGVDLYIFSGTSFPVDGICIRPLSSRKFLACWKSAEALANWIFLIHTMNHCLWLSLKTELADPKFSGFAPVLNTMQFAMSMFVLPLPVCIYLFDLCRVSRPVLFLAPISTLLSLSCGSSLSGVISLATRKAPGDLNGRVSLAWAFQTKMKLDREVSLRVSLSSRRLSLETLSIAGALCIVLLWPVITWTSSDLSSWPLAFSLAFSVLNRVSTDFPPFFSDGDFPLDFLSE